VKGAHRADEDASKFRYASVAALAYIALASLWIAGSSYLVEATVADPGLRGRIELVKGLAFVLTTGLVLFFLLFAPRAPALHPVAEAASSYFSGFRGFGIALLLLAPLISAGIYYFAKPAVQKQTYLRLQTIVDLELVSIDIWLAERSQDIDALLYSRYFRANLSDYLDNHAGRDRSRELLEDRLQAVLRAYDYSSVTILDTRLEPIVHVGVPLEKNDILAPHPIDRSDPVDTAANFRMSATRGQQVVVDVSAPVLDDREGENAALLGYIQFRNYPIESLISELGDLSRAARTLETLLVDLHNPDGITGIHLSQIDSEESRLIDLTGDAGILREGAGFDPERGGNLKGVDQHGNPVLGFIRPVHELGWFLLAKVDRTEVFTTLRNLALWVGLASMAVLVAINVILFQFWIQQRRTYELALVEESEQFARATIDSLELNIAVLDAQGVILTTNNKWERFASANDGDSAAVSTGVNYMEVCKRSAMTGDGDAAVVLRGIEDVISGRSDNFWYEYPCHSEDESRWFIVDITAFPGEASNRRIVVAHHDVSQRKLAELRLQRLNRFYAALSKMNKAIIRTTSPEQILRDVCRISSEYGDLELVWVAELTDLGWLNGLASCGPEAEFSEAIEVSRDGDLPEGRGVIGDAIRSGTPSLANDIEAADVAAHWYEQAQEHGLNSILACPVNRAGEVWGVLAFFTSRTNFFTEDLTALLEELTADLAYSLDMLTLRKEREEAQAQLVMNANIIESTHEGLFITDQGNKITLVNPALCEMTGYSEEELIGASPSIFKSSEHNNAFFESMWHELLHHGKWEGEIRNRRRDGEVYPAWLAITQVREGHGGRTYYITIMRDITAYKEHEAQIRHIASHDILTDLPNRLLFEGRAEHSIEQAHRSGRKVAVFFVDLDGFKLINDTLGHNVGDALLKEVSHRISGIMRKADTVSRIGGDEFIVLLAEISSAEDAAVIAEKVNEAISRPMDIHDHQLIVTASIGIAIYPENGDSVSELTHMADVAMLAAKQSGRDSFHFYSDEMSKHANVYLQLRNELRYAIERDQLYLVYQPQLSIEDKRLVGVEALLRWRHPELGEVPTGEFIRIAEDSGQIVEIGAWVMTEACRQAQAWKHSGVFDAPVSVNVSALQFRQPGFLDTVTAILEETGLEASALDIEVTETLLMSSSGQALDKLYKLHDLGVKISVDDFGTGYSSLAYLRQIPANRLKIDQSFVQDLPGSENAVAIIRAIVGFGSTMGLDIIAEGIETREQADFLGEIGCPSGQGYFYSKPLPTDEFAAWLAKVRGTD